MGEVTTQDDRKNNKNIREGQQRHCTKCQAAQDHTRNGSKIVLRSKVDNIK